MAYDDGLAQRIRELVAESPEVSERKMFGGLAFLQAGYMFVGINGDELMARVGPDNYQGALAKPHVCEMDFTGRALKGYVYVDPAGIEDDAELDSWVEMASEFVAELPPKAVK